MEKYENIIYDMESALDLLESETEDILIKAEAGIKITREALEKIKEIVTKSKFVDAGSEILFFKKLKPSVYSKLIYYVKLFNIESKRPRGKNKSQIKYFNNHIDKLQIFFNDNLEFYQYYRRGATFLDEHFFLREKVDIRLHSDTFHFFTDKQFSTSHDSIVATILAYDMLIVHLKKEIYLLENNYANTSSVLNSLLSSKLFWTGTKTDLVELIYALLSSNVINSGTADIKELASVFEKIFNIELGDYYRTFMEIRSRKNNRTKMLDKLKEALVQKLNFLDE